MRVSSSSSFLLASLAVSTLAAPVPGGSETKAHSAPGEPGSPTKRGLTRHNHRSPARRAVESSISTASSMASMTSLASISSFPSSTSLPVSTSLQLPGPSPSLAGRAFDVLQGLMNALDIETPASSSVDKPSGASSNTPSTTPSLRRGFDPLKDLMNALDIEPTSSIPSAVSDAPASSGAETSTTTSVNTPTATPMLARGFDPIGDLMNALDHDIVSEEPSAIASGSAAVPTTAAAPSDTPSGSALGTGDDGKGATRIARGIDVPETVPTSLGTNVQAPTMVLSSAALPSATAVPSAMAAAALPTPFWSTTAPIPFASFTQLPSKAVDTPAPASSVPAPAPSLAIRFSAASDAADGSTSTLAARDATEGEDMMELGQFMDLMDTLQDVPADGDTATSSANASQGTASANLGSSTHRASETQAAGGPTIAGVSSMNSAAGGPPTVSVTSVLSGAPAPVETNAPTLPGLLAVVPVAAAPSKTSLVVGLTTMAPTPTVDTISGVVPTAATTSA